MTEQLKIMIGQLNPVLGGIAENAKKAIEFYQQSVAKGADYALTSELFLTGYSAKDLFLRPAFVDETQAAIDRICAACTAQTILGLGTPVLRDGVLHIAYLYIQGGKIIEEVHKHNRPNYDVFDEHRWFGPGQFPSGHGAPKVNTAICEDVWHESYGKAILPSAPEILIAPNASPYYRGKIHARHENARERVRQLATPLIYTHFVGVEDEMVFDGGSFVMNPDGTLGAQLPLFEEAREMVTLEKRSGGWFVAEGVKAELPNEYESDYRAMVTALRDYGAETGFQSAILGLSGGVDSALVAAIAADAFGPENVRTLMMPSRYTSQESLNDAAECAERLGIAIESVSISPAVDAINDELEPIFGADPDGLTAENIQPRLRALYLMALSNKFGGLLLTTGNKSEVAVGYATLYGDMAGGYNPIKDLYKMRVFETCRWRNANHRAWMKGRAGEVILKNIIQKPPTAELRPDQKDSDSLPEYSELDPILEAMVDEDKSVDEIIAMGYARETVLKVQKLVFIAEYKRFQAAPGAKLTKRHFGTDRRYPIMNAWRDG